MLLLAIALCVLLAGCAGGPTAGRGQSQSLAGGPAAGPPGPSHPPAPGNATPITVRKTLDPDAVGYNAENGSVRYVAGWRHVNQEAMEEGAPPTREPMYEWVPVGVWAQKECLSVSSAAVREHLDGAIDANSSEAISVGASSLGGEFEVFVELQTVLDRDGSVVSEPSLGYPVVRNHTPASVNATIVLADREFTCRPPVTVRETVLRYN